MSTPSAAVRPIILGGDIGAYGTARAFHEAFGVRSVVIAGVSTGAVAHSAVVEHRVVPEIEDTDALVEAVRAATTPAPSSSRARTGWSARSWSSGTGSRTSPSFPTPTRRRSTS
jgi:D-aspartate ligase